MNRIKIFVIICFIFTVIACHLSPEIQKSVNSSVPFDLQNTKEAILRYKTWKPVTAKPEFMDPMIEAFCADTRAAIINPHHRKYIRVYVNDIGQEAMFKEDNPKFPVGSIIVKEKLPDENSSISDLQTIMIKREKDFDAANGDWQYMVMNAAESSIEAPRHLFTCQSCHIEFQDKSDYVSRNYLHFGENQNQTNTQQPPSH